MSSNVTLSCYNGDRKNQEHCFQEPILNLPAHQPHTHPAPKHRKFPYPGATDAHIMLRVPLVTALSTRHHQAVGQRCNPSSLLLACRLPPTLSINSPGVSRL